MKFFTALLALLAFTSNVAFAGRLQNEDFKTPAQLTGAGVPLSHLLNDTNIWVTGNGINDQLSNAIVNGQLGGSGGGSGGVELLPNPGFESGGVTNGWTATGLTASNVTSGANLLAGNKTAQIVSTAAGQTFKSAALPIKAQLAGGSCSAQVYYLASTAAFTLSAFDGTNTLNSQALPAQSGAPIPATITFPCGASATSTLQWILTSTAAGTIYADTAHLGSLNLFQGLVNGGPSKMYLLTATSGTFTPDAGATQLEVIAVAGGGGGGGNGTGTGGAGTAGGNTTFGSLITATAGGGSSGYNPGAGGSGTVTPPATGVVFPGSDGMSGSNTGGGQGYYPGGAGGAGFLGGQGAALLNNGGSPPVANTGSGGVGASGTGSTNAWAGGGGGAGGAVDAFVTVSSGQTFAYAIGGGGIGGSGPNYGTSGAGGAIIVKESFQSVTQQAYLPSSGGLAAGQLSATLATSCPTGTVPADGTVYTYAAQPALCNAIGQTYGGTAGTSCQVANLMGIFARGAGTQTIGGLGYTATQGGYQNDQFQGHYHQQGSFTTNLQNYGSDTGLKGGTSGSEFYQSNNNVLTPSGDGTDGTPRYGAETRPANVGVLYCVQTQAASAAPLTVNGVVSTDNSTGTTYVNTSATYTAAATLPNTIDHAHCNATAGAFNLTAPTSPAKSQRMKITKDDSSANLCGFTANIHGTNRTTYLHRQDETIELEWNGTYWGWNSDSYRTESATFNTTCGLTQQSGTFIASVSGSATGPGCGMTFQTGIFYGQNPEVSGVTLYQYSDQWLALSGLSQTGMSFYTRSTAATQPAQGNIVTLTFHGPR